jgi:hypothetical protein
MTEQSEAEKYIKCSKCRCKYINDDEHIKNDFGYNRLNERFKTCVVCRARNRVNDKTYRSIHQAEITERTRDYRKQYFQDHKEQYQERYKQYRERQLNKEVDDNNRCCTRCYKIQPITYYGEYKGIVKIDGELKEAMIPYNSCVECRDKDKARRRGINLSSKN